MKQILHATNKWLSTALLLAASLVLPAKADTFLVSSPGTQSIVEFDSLGNHATFAHSGLSIPVGLALDRHGNLYVGDSGPSLIYKYDPFGNKSVYPASGVFKPVGLAFDANGNLYVANNGDYEILKVTPQGQSTVIASYPSIFGPQALAFDKSGNLYVANSGANTVEKITPSGSASVFANTGFDTTPEGLAFDSSGRLYVACTANNTIEEFDSQGSGRVFADSELDGPRGLAFDSSGNLYVANYNNGTIVRFNPEGEGTVVISSGLKYPCYIAVMPHIQSPMITCPAPLVLECTNGSAVGTLQASVLDTNGYAMQVVWTVDGTPYQTNDILPGGEFTASNVTFTAVFGSGEHTVVVSASNGWSVPASCSTTVAVSDTTPPRILDISATPDLLWPPNHRMVPVRVIVDAVDNCDPSPVAQITRITCNEPQGHFAPDWSITGPLTADLRAERLGGEDRIYTIHVDVSDSSGNTTATSVSVTVPKAMSASH